MTATRTPSTSDTSERSEGARDPWRWALWGTWALLGVVVLLEVLPGTVGLVRDLSALRERQAEVVRAQTAGAEVVRLDAEQERLEQALATSLGVDESPSADGVGALGALRQSAAEAGVDLVRVEPGASGEDGASVEVRSVEVRSVEVRSVEVRVEGDGHGVGRFVDEIERGARLARVRSLSVRGPGTRAGVETTATVSVEFAEIGRAEVGG